MSGLIDASILKPELANSLAEGYRQSGEERHKREMDRATLATLEQQRESNQLTLERLKQEREMMLDLQSKLKAIGRDPDLNKVFDAFIASGNPDYVMKGYEGKRKLQEQARADDVLRQYAPELFPPGPSAPGGTAPGTVAPAGTVNAMAPSAPSSAVPGAPSGTVAPAGTVAPTGTVAPAGTVNAMAPRTAPATEVNALRQQLAALSSVDDPRAKAMAEVVRDQLQELTKRHVVGRTLVTGDNRVLYQAPEPTQTTSPAEQQRLENERRRIGLEERRVEALEENARREADPAFQQRMAAARTLGQKAAEGDVAAVQALPKVISRAEEGVRLIDELIGKRDSEGHLIEGSKPHPGFQNAVGATWLPGTRFIPGTDVAGFMSRFDQIKGASFLEAFESLKGGGAVTEKEGAKGTDAINRMSTSTDEKEFIRAALDLRAVILKGVENAKKRAARAGGAAPAAPTAPPTDDAEFMGFE